MPLPPGPAAPPVLQTWDWVRRPTHLLQACRRRFGPTFTLRVVGGRTFVVVTDPEDVQAVFTGGDLFLGGVANKNFRRFAGPATLLSLDGEAHQRHRRLILPAFHGERMRAYGPLLLELVRDEVARWPRGRAFRLLPAFRRVTLEAILRGIFGLEDPARRDALRAALERLAARTTAPLTFLPALHVDLGPWSPWGAFVRARAAVDRLLFAEIARARRDVAAGTPREDVLAKLVEEGARRGDPFSDGELRDELITLLAAGHETTATGLAWTFRYLLGDPRTLARVRAEVEEVRGADGALDPGRLERLPLVDACVAEGLRLAPPLPMLLRVLARDARVAGHDLPAGTHVAPAMWLAHREPARWPDPERFDVDRWLGGRPKPSPNVYFPFGGGPRICIGRAFGLFEMRVVLAATLARAPGLRLAGPPSRRVGREAVVVVPRDGTRVILDDFGASRWPLA